MSNSRHMHWMRQCLRLAQRGQSRVSPNPRVGAVVVSEHGRLLGQGWHQYHGGPHAEHMAILDALERGGRTPLRSATLYVNLEPCAHLGKTPPCTVLIRQHDIPRVVAGMADPNPKAAGGAQFLRSHGIAVELGVLEDACKRLNEPFLHRFRCSRPLVTLKIAQTLDGRIATAAGHSRWISGPKSRQLVHAMRADHDGVLVGRGTAAADNPSLTVRHVEGPNPRRYVLDRPGSLPAGLALFCDGRPTTAIIGMTATPAYERSLVTSGGEVLRAPSDGGHINLHALFDRLPIQSLLVEAGPNFASALLKQDLVDRLFIFVAPKIFGDGIPALRGLDVATAADAITFVEHQWEEIGDDILFRGFLRAV